MKLLKHILRNAIADWVKQTLKNSGTTSTTSKTHSVGSVALSVKYVRDLSLSHIGKAKGWYKKHPEDGNFRNALLNESQICELHLNAGDQVRKVCFWAIFSLLIPSEAPFLRIREIVIFTEKTYCSKSITSFRSFTPLKPSTIRKAVFLKYF